MRVHRSLLRQAQEMGFVFLRQARHGQLWRHIATGRTCLISRAENHKGHHRSMANAVSELHRAAS
jgi:hypothetical protein